MEQHTGMEPSRVIFRTIVLDCRPDINRLGSNRHLSHLTSTIGIRPLCLIALIMAVSLTACGGTDSRTASSYHNVYGSAGTNGQISPPIRQVDNGDSTTFSVTPDSGFFIDSIIGCDGSLTANTYTTGAITSDCSVTVNFTNSSGGGGSSGGLHSVYAGGGLDGTISPPVRLVNTNDTTTFTITPDSGFVASAAVGCAGTLVGNTYTTGPITGDCSVVAIFASIPGSPTLGLSFTPVKNLQFTWTDVAGASFYRLLEDPDGISGFVQVGSDIPAATGLFDHQVPLYQRLSAKYILQACISAICTDSATVLVTGTMLGSIGYFKATNSATNDEFGGSVSISADGNTLAIGARFEDSNATGVDGSETNNSRPNSGAVYVFLRDGASWSRQAYLKASNTDANDYFGGAVSISADGNTLAVGARLEDSSATGINNAQNNTNPGKGSGAVYVFLRSGTSWSQQAYIKASNTGKNDEFGGALIISGDGNTLAIGAKNEDSNATGIDFSQTNNSAANSGAAYLFVRSGSIWSQQSYIKASNTGANDNFGLALSISADGDTLAIGASNEDSNATGINIGQADNSAANAGAVYLFSRSGVDWFQQAYLKAGNSDANDEFGGSVSISADGDLLAVGARNEQSNATGVDGDETDNSATNSGAVYLFARSGGTWSSEAYLKASNTEANDAFGASVSISTDGNTLAIGARNESSNATALNGDENDNSTSKSGAVYLFVRSGGSWSQGAYLKASNTQADDEFGSSVSIASNGNTLAVSASFEDSNATTVGGDNSDNSASKSGAVYLY